MAAFFDQFALPILLAIRARMDRELRSAWDSADFVQQTHIKLDSCDLAGKHFATVIVQGKRRRRSRRAAEIRRRAACATPSSDAVRGGRGCRG